MREVSEPSPTENVRILTYFGADATKFRDLSWSIFYGVR